MVLPAIIYVYREGITWIQDIGMYEHGNGKDEDKIFFASTMMDRTLLWYTKDKKPDAFLKALEEGGFLAKGRLGMTLNGKFEKGFYAIKVYLFRLTCTHIHHRILFYIIPISIHISLWVNVKLDFI